MWPHYVMEILFFMSETVDGKVGTKGNQTVSKTKIGVSKQNKRKLEYNIKHENNTSSVAKIRDQSVLYICDQKVRGVEKIREIN